eukprot:12033973-Alexandrium_andersonii.AAC.1
MDLLREAPQGLLRGPGQLLELKPLVAIDLARGRLAGAATPGRVDHRALHEPVLARAAARVGAVRQGVLSLIHISEPTRLALI